MVTGTIRLLVIAVAATAGAALAQPATEAEQALLERIARLQAEQGTTAEGLIDPLRELALLYQEVDAHAQAVVALQEARQVLRANRGLFSNSVDEALVLRQQIVSEKALGNGERVWNLQHDMMVIAEQHLDDLRVLPIFLELLDDRTELFNEFSTTDYRELPAGIYVPCTTGGGPQYRGQRSEPPPVSDARNCPFGSFAMVVARLRNEVARQRSSALAVIVRNGDYASRELRDLERQALRRVPFERFPYQCTVRKFLESELVGSCLDPIHGAGGWLSLMRLVYYEVRSGAPAAARATAYAELGDWYVRAEHLSSTPKFSPADETALRLYERAFSELGQGDEARESIAEIFSPELPVTLPTYGRNRLASTESSRFIDVAFAITKYGKAENIETLDSSENATRAEQRELTRLIEFASYRPRAVDGELADSAPVVVRYYLPENPVSSTGSGR